VNARAPSGDDDSGALRHDVQRCVNSFVQWVQQYGWWSRDHQSWYAGALGGRAKGLYYSHPRLGMLAVSPMVLGEALLPASRRFFHRPLRFPIADAHFAMGFLYLYAKDGSTDDYRIATNLLEYLAASRCPGYVEYCWGYPFDWVTRNGTISANTPLITSTPYVYEAFLEVYRVDEDSRWRAILDSIIRHALQDIHDFKISDTASTCSYTPFDRGGVINASAYRAFMLTSAWKDLDVLDAKTPAQRNLNFVLESQRPDGSWPYAVDGQREFVDHFHTCFVLKALAKIYQLTSDERCRESIDRGVDYYLAQLFDREGLPKPFARAPRLTVYRRELYDYAECVNLCLLLRHRRPEMNTVLVRVLKDLLSRWVRGDGSFRSRELLVGWDNVPMHRWAQSQMFRSLALFLSRECPRPRTRSGDHREENVRNLRTV
jgi:hypothetical protein